MKLVFKPLALLAMLFVVFWITSNDLHAQDKNRAAIVISYDDQQIETACVEFEEPQISGLDLVQQSGLELEIEAQGLGALVCSINDAGCPASDCLCQCRSGGECIYWSYWHQLKDGWRYAEAGANGYLVEPGSVEGWAWGPGAESQAIPPPEISFEDICSGQTSDDLPLVLPPSNVSGTISSSPSLERNSDYSALSDGFPYAIFLVILGGLGTILYFISWRRKNNGLH